MKNRLLILCIFSRKNDVGNSFAPWGAGSSDGFGISAMLAGGSERDFGHSQSVLHRQQHDGTHFAPAGHLAHAHVPIAVWLDFGDGDWPRDDD